MPAAALKGAVCDGRVPPHCVGAGSLQWRGDVATHQQMPQGQWRSDAVTLEEADAMRDFLGCVSTPRFGNVIISISKFGVGGGMPSHPRLVFECDSARMPG